MRFSSFIDSRIIFVPWMPTCPIFGCRCLKWRAVNCRMGSSLEWGAKTGGNCRKNRGERSSKVTPDSCDSFLFDSMLIFAPWMPTCPIFGCRIPKWRAAELRRLQDGLQPGMGSKIGGNCRKNRGERNSKVTPDSCIRFHSFLHRFYDHFCSLDANLPCFWMQDS